MPGVDDGAAPSSSRATAGAQAASSSGGGGHGGGSGLAARLAPPELRHQAAALLQRGATWLVNRRRNRGATAGRGGGTSAGAAGSSSAAAAATAEDETAPLQRVDSVGHIALRRSSLLATLKETPPPSPLRPMAQPRQLLEPITPTLVPVDIGAGTEAGVKGEAERVEPLDQESGGSEVDNLEAAASADDFEGGGDGTSSAAGELRTSPPTADHVISRLEVRDRDKCRC